MVPIFTIGKFNVESIMPYGSLRESKDGSSPIIIRKSDRQPFPDGWRIAARDCEYNDIKEHKVVMQPRLIAIGISSRQTHISRKCSAARTGLI
jgi:hypothetical protein